MNLKEGSVLYARIDYKIGDRQETEQDAMDSMEYLQKIAAERYLAAGVFGNMELGTMDGAMVLFEAKNLAEAQKIANDDPIIQRGYYRCDVYQWNVMLLSKNAG
ncbi:hypothetical protein D1641_00145 [Colidextribacter sp. OB.20]|uniref:YciI family protein n=1 Tax=Colidextribacter sp. OB.20 TaxID=2304568 RepID=UPI00136809B1|nr:YciI family protein [Colidextribacter sp. OB.20]NBI08431.1 hypothetical protein [Colidextribacter sp. OB.20]